MKAPRYRPLLEGEAPLNWGVVLGAVLAAVAIGAALPAAKKWLDEQIALAAVQTPGPVGHCPLPTVDETLVITVTRARDDKVNLKCATVVSRGGARRLGL